MTNIGFLGLGAMGTAMARRLVEAGHRVTVWNRSPEPVDKLVGAGANRGAAAADAIANPVVISMLADDSAVETVFTPEALSAAPEGAVHVNMASVSIRAAERMQLVHERAQRGYLAAPVLGRPPVAAAGGLTIVTGGSADLVDAVRPVLDRLGQRIWHVGEEPASANLVKIAVNFTIIHALQALGEGAALVESAGVDAGLFVDVLNSSLFPGPVYDGYGHMIAQRRYVPAGFGMSLGRKDLRLAEEAAEAHGVELASMPALVDAFEAAMADRTLSDLDWSAVAEVTRERSGATALPPQRL